MISNKTYGYDGKLIVSAVVQEGDLTIYGQPVWRQIINDNGWRYMLTVLAR